ncbi:hypothetical protein AMTR_s00151p00074930 [Amborella trichopoda]|uniref:Uncharacterized protein n=1 Tax=Amborella trichopoda TaxID=13333 RepID=W1NJZ8_AMBTC|nr:hypothetical protein AMTR_s00151p00074930 [Amborella trichopoda]
MGQADKSNNLWSGVAGKLNTSVEFVGGDRAWRLLSVENTFFDSWLMVQFFRAWLAWLIFPFLLQCRHSSLPETMLEGGAQDYWPYHDLSKWGIPIGNNHGSSCETTGPGEENQLFLVLCLRFGDGGPTVCNSRHKALDRRGPALLLLIWVVVSGGGGRSL